MRTKTFFLINIVCIFLFWVQAAAWEGPDISGYVSQYTVYRVADADNSEYKSLMKIEEKLRVDLEHSVSIANLFVSGEAIYDPKAHNDWVDDDFSERYHRTFFRLKEAYVDLGFENFDLRLGNQVVVWGKSDGMPITDVITPIDLSEYVIPDFEDQRLGVPAAKLSYYVGDFTFEGVVLPWFYESNLPHDGHWKIKPDFDEFERDTNIPNIGLGGIRITEDEPDGGEFGFRVSGLLANTDIAVMYFHGHEDTPSVSGQSEYIIVNAPSTPLVKSPIGYARMNMFGLNFSRPWSKFVLRGEAAYFRNKRFYSQKTEFDPSPNAREFFKKDMLQYMVGADFSGITNITLSLQFEEKYILDFDSEEGLIRSVAVAKTSAELNSENALESLAKITDIQKSDEGKLIEAEDSITFSANGRFMQETVQTDLLLMYNLDYDDYYLKLSLGYNISDATWAHVGYVRLGGDNTTTYGMFDHNDSVFFKLKYSF